MNQIIVSHRWNLTANGHLDFTTWVLDVKINYKKKKIVVKLFDDKGGSVFNWMQDLIENTELKKHLLVLTHYNEQGEAETNITFKNLELLDHLVLYSYEDKPVFLNHKVLLSYTSVERLDRLTTN